MISPQAVEGQSRTRAPFGLFSVVSFRATLASDTHWENGVEWEALTCDPVSGDFDPECGDPTENHFPEGFSVGEAAPFYVYGAYRCGALSRSFEDAQERARDHLLAREEAKAEGIFLGNLTGTESIGASLSAAEALARAERYIATYYGSRGTIVVSRAGASVLQDSLVSLEEHLFTRLGTPVAAVSAPVDPSDSLGVIWAFPALFGYRGQIFNSSTTPGDLMDRARNDMYAVAKRAYVIGYDPCGVGTATFLLTSASGGGGGGLTNAELRASPIDVNAVVTVTDALTDAELRASPVPVEVSNFPASVEISNDVGNPIPISGTQLDALTDAELRAADVNVADSGEREYTHVVATVTAAGDTVIHTPALGMRIRLRWIYAIALPGGSNPVIDVKLGSSILYRVFALSKRQRATGDVDAPLTINLSTSGSVAVTALLEEVA